MEAVFGDPFIPVSQYSRGQGEPITRSIADIRSPAKSCWLVCNGIYVALNLSYLITWQGIGSVLILISVAEELAFLDAAVKSPLPFQ